MINRISDKTPLLSLCICVWNTSHLLKRSIRTYCNQDFPAEDWELIIIDDNSDDNVLNAISYAIGKINFTYIRLNHPHGMRGNTVAFNTAFEIARGFVIAETTAETLFQPDIVRKMYELHVSTPAHEEFPAVYHENRFVSFKTYNLTQETQLLIDTVNWITDLDLIKTLPGFDCPWTKNNEDKTHFGTHQTCSIRKDTFYRIWGAKGFPLYCDYGSEDPAYCGLRERMGIEDITVMTPMPIHQWHLPFQYWMAKGKGPKFNKHAHTMENYMHDTSGEVPEGGTCMIWDGGSHEQLSEQECAEWAKWDEMFLKTGGDERCLKA